MSTQQIATVRITHRHDVPDFNAPVLPSTDDTLFVSLSAAQEDGGNDADWDWDADVADEIWSIRNNF